MTSLSLNKRHYSLFFVGGVALLASFLSAKIIVFHQLNLLILVFGPLVFLLFLVQGIRTIITVFILTCYGNYFVYWFDLPRFLTWHLELAAMAMFIRLLGFWMTTKDFSLRRPFPQILVLLLLAHFTSFCINGQEISRLFVSARVYYVFMIIFSAIITFKGSEKVYEKLIKVIIFTAFIQFPIAIIQYFVFVRADFIGGLLGKHASGTISVLAVSFVFLGYYLHKYYRKKPIFIISSIGMFITLILAESKFGMLLMPLAFFYNKKVERIPFRSWRLIFIIPVYLLAMLAFDKVNGLKLPYRPYMQKTIDEPLYLIRMSSRNWSVDKHQIDHNPDEYFHPSMGRLASIPFAFDYIKKSAGTLLFGYGPGETAKDSFFTGNLTYLGYFRTYAVILILEWGLIGTLLWSILLLYLFIINLRCLRYFQETNVRSVWKPFCYFSNMQMFVFLFGYIYNPLILGEHVGLFFWLTNGLMVWYYQNKIDVKKRLLKV